MENKVANIAFDSATSIAEFGVLGAIAVVSICFSLLAGWVLIKQAQSCFEGTKKVVDNNTEAVNALGKSTSEALHGVQVALMQLQVGIERIRDR